MTFFASEFGLRANRDIKNSTTSPIITCNR